MTRRYGGWLVTSDGNWNREVIVPSNNTNQIMLHNNWVSKAQFTVTTSLPGQEKPDGPMEWLDKEVQRITDKVAA